MRDSDLFLPLEPDGPLWVGEVGRRACRDGKGFVPSCSPAGTPGTPWLLQNAHLVL